jgi:predicted transcriptional regulator
MKIFICFNLKDEVEPEPFEGWMKSEFQKALQTLKGAKSVEIRRVSNIMKGEFPYHYILEVELENEMALMLVAFNAELQDLIKQFATKAASFSIIKTVEVK